jgi:hypothetical protein
MAVTVSFNNPNSFDITSSGVGAFGSGGFGVSVPVGEYQGSTYVTNSSASLQGPALNNIKYVTSASGLLNGSTLLNLRAIPNSQSTFEIRIASDVAIQIQNARLYVTERASTTGMPAGMTIQAAEIDHTGSNQVNDGLGNTSWAAIGGSGFYLALGNSPGPSGMTSGASVLHSYYIAMSLSPNSVGSKTATARFQAEFF